MTEDQFHAHRTTLANNFAAAGAELLEFMRAPGTLAAIPNTSPEQYVVAGDLVAIQALLPNRRERRGQRPKDELYFGPEADQPRRWSILITEGGKGVVADYGYRFPEASAELERVDVVEVAAPVAAQAGQVAPADDDLLDVVRTLCTIAARRAELSVEKRKHYPHADEEGSPLLAAARAACLARGYTEDGLGIPGVSYPTPSAAAQVAVPEMTDEQIVAVWQSMPGGPDGWLKQFGYLQFARAVLAAAPVPCAVDLLEEIAQSWDGCEYPDAMIKDIGAALRHDFARFAAAPSAPVVAQQAPADWISVDERLPENGKDVIILHWPYDNHENERVANTAHHVDGVFYDEDGNNMHPPSHWMPFVIPADTPSPAKESK